MSRWTWIAGVVVAGGLLAAVLAGAREEQPAPPVAPPPPARATIVLAGGCFWCLESDFDRVPGVVGTVSGYAGGSVEAPTYEQVSRGGTGHAEVVEVTYDPAVIGLDQVLDRYWRFVDPTDAGGQFCDRGSQYRSAIFWSDDAQREAALASKARVQRTKPFEAPIVTTIEKLDRFWPAEAYHQGYHDENPIRYAYYRRGCGRDRRVAELWGDEAAQD